MMLTSEGHQVEWTNTREDALKHLAAFRPDVALLDIGLPGMSGYELARRIRALPGLERVRLIALTGYGQAEDKAQARSAGFDDHLVKPADVHAFHRVLATDAITERSWQP